MLFTNTTILTLNDRREILQDGAILVSGNRVADIGKTTDLTEQYPSESVVDLHGNITLPGLFDTHVHTAQCMLRGISEATPPPDFHSWLFGRIFTLQGAYTYEDALASASLCVLEMLKSGTTSFVECLLAKHYGLDGIAEMCIESGIRAALGNLVMDVAPKTRDELGWPIEMWQTRESGIELTIEGNQKWTDPDGRLQIWFGCRSVEVGNNLSLFEEVSQLSREHDIGITIHLAELPHDNDYARSLGHRSHIELANHLGLLGPRTVLAHCTVADDEDIQLLADTGTSVAHCPANNSSSGWGPTRVADMLAAGVNVTLGCDGAPSNANMDVLREMRIATHVARMHENTRLAITPEAVLEMATRNGARALGMGDDLGSLEPGKKADFIVVNVDAPHMQPIWSPAATVVFAAQGSDVDTVVIDGRVIVAGGEALTMDEEAIVAEAKQRQIEVAARTNIIGMDPLWPVV
ncbi:MAG: amidohydrolase family protein [Acidimicrobiales bacterium]